MATRAQKLAAAAARLEEARKILKVVAEEHGTAHEAVKEAEKVFDAAVREIRD
jgi:hypothetical protein